MISDGVGDILDLIQGEVMRALGGFTGDMEVSGEWWCGLFRGTFEGVLGDISGHWREFLGLKGVSRGSIWKPLILR